MNGIQPTLANVELATAVMETARRREESWPATLLPSSYTLTIEQAAQPVSPVWRNLVIMMLYASWNDALAWANAVSLAKMIKDQAVVE